MCDVALVELTLGTESIGNLPRSRLGSLPTALGVAGSNPAAPTTFQSCRSHIGHRRISRGERSLEVTQPVDLRRRVRRVRNANPTSSSAGDSAWFQPKRVT